MSAEVNIFVGNYTIIDHEIYELWVAGHSVSEAVNVMKTRGVLELWGATIDLLQSDVADHYRTFDMLEKLLPTPVMLAEEWTFQMHPLVQKFVIEQFYSFDGPVIREILGKKLSGRTRKDLDDVADKTGTKLRSCRRQFDNVKRIYKHLDDMSGSMKQNIQNNFLLSPSLAQKYAAIVFLMSNRFEASKRKLCRLNLDHFTNCALAMMTSWTSLDDPENNDECDLEREFLINLREIKVLIEKEKEHRNLTVGMLKNKVPERLLAELEGNFKTFSRPLIQIGVNLINARHLRDFFVEVLEKFIEPCRMTRWNSQELDAFLEAYALAPTKLDLLSNDATMKSTWERYMNTMRICIRHLYEKV